MSEIETNPSKENSPAQEADHPFSTGVSVDGNTITINEKGLETLKKVAGNLEGSEKQGDVAADQLRLFIERIERLEEEKKGMADDIKDVYSEAKSQGYDAKIMKQIVSLRKMDTADRQEMEAILDTYKAALGLS